MTYINNSLLHCDKAYCDNKEFVSRSLVVSAVKMTGIFHLVHTEPGSGGVTPIYTCRLYSHICDCIQSVVSAQSSLKGCNQWSKHAQKHGQLLQNGKSGKVYA